MFNLSFFIKFIGNYIFFLQFSEYKYAYKQMLKLDSFIIYFNIINITDLDQTAISNYIYFYKYFFGIIPYYTNYKHKFHLNIHYFSFFLQYILKKKNIYNYIYIIFNDIYSIINKSYIELKNGLNFFEIKIIDMNFFIERKNTLGFFSLIDSVIFKFFIIKNLNFDHNNIIYLLKLKI